MSRSFNGSTDSVHFSIGACDNSAHVTIAAIAKRNANTSPATAQAILQLHNSGGSGSFAGLYYDEGDVITLFNSVTGASSTFTITTSDGWHFVAGGKSTGTNAPRLHKYVYTTDTWTHETSADTLTNGATPGAGGTVRIAEFEANMDLNADLVIVGMFSRNLTDAEIETLPFCLTNWYLTNGLIGLWLMNQSATTQNIIDSSGGGANQATLNGTSVGTSSVPIFGYGGRISVSRTAAAAASFPPKRIIAVVGKT